MAQVTLVIIDTDEEGGVNLHATFTPEIKMDGVLSPAQRSGIAAIEAIKKLGENDESEEDDNESD